MCWVSWSTGRLQRRSWNLEEELQELSDDSEYEPEDPEDSEDSDDSDRQLLIKLFYISMIS